MRRIYLDPARQSGESNALVHINRQGDLGGFLGVLKARYELNGAALNAAIIGRSWQTLASITALQDRNCCVPCIEVNSICS
ncbi:hypothetical protein [Mesorhizobium sp. B3-2-1]|uniref:hypothetical protein n=1 Tax=Mesorhizobium sp. B3-2-1 TaxID=2589891 RepID=UPI001FEF37AF|nr:hypothetical protein [Mesorhizobium sp. B3-2-1]